MISFFNSLRRPAGVLALGGSVALAAGCAPAVTVQDEVQLGQQLSAQINRELPLVSDPTAVQYINRLGRSISDIADPRGIPYNFYIVNDASVNAFAVPGGHIYINRGLIERAENLSEVAGVLAHEVGHVVHRHGIEQWRRAQQAEMGLAVLYGILLGRPPAGVEQAAIQIGGTAVFAGYSREAEREADQVAIEYLIRRGIHPMGLVTMFEKLMAESQRDPSRVEQWFATHPTTQERIDNTRADIQSLPAATLSGLTRDSQEFQQFRQRVGSLAAARR
jgi:beta-barrel assembly-enhancing protease